MISSTDSARSTLLMNSLEAFDAATKREELE